MAALESEHIYGVQLRESADDGSDFSNADADYRILFLGEDGLLHVKDAAGSVTDPYTGGAGTLPFFSRRLMAFVAATTHAINTSSYGSAVALRFYHDFDAFAATHFWLTCYGQSSEAAQTVSLQLTKSADPTNPVSASGDDLVITNSLGLFSSGWVAVSDALTGIQAMQVSNKGSNATVDLSLFWLDIAFKVV